MSDGFAISLRKQRSVKSPSPIASGDYSASRLAASEGKALNEQTRRIAARLMQARHAVCFGDVVGMAINAPPAFANDLGLMLSMERGSFGITYHFNGERNAWLCSLRSNGSVNVGLLAEQFGGGGNERAAGFSVQSGECDFLFPASKGVKLQKHNM
ncbi:DHH family phosphoesterase [Methylosarcina fibrata]|jgi:nanoRNase/pAp phosphatase (c-di-AMP/oligoRNAs hydrolase)|uniref:hypothetical protein n=1 Tax=Methylosarcina fibrata TaxID=105972 RepID=UPI000361DD81|nr:hypothetical protein [Methylosarcina fibrata]